MPETAELAKKLKDADPEIQEYVSALKAELTRLHKRVAKLEAENVSLESRIEALKQDPLAEHAANFSEDKFVEEITPLLHELGYEVRKREGGK